MCDFSLAKPRNWFTGPEEEEHYWPPSLTDSLEKDETPKKTGQNLKCKI